MCERASEWMALEDLPPGAVFETRDGVLAVKSEYHYGDSDTQSQCILLDGGEFAHFPEKNAIKVRQIIVK